MAKLLEALESDDRLEHEVLKDMDPAASFKSFTGYYKGLGGCAWRVGGLSNWLF